MLFDESVGVIPSDRFGLTHETVLIPNLRPEFVDPSLLCPM